MSAGKPIDPGSDLKRHPATAASAPVSGSDAESEAPAVADAPIELLLDEDDADMVSYLTAKGLPVSGGRVGGVTSAGAAGPAGTFSTAGAAPAASDDEDLAAAVRRLTSDEPDGPTPPRGMRAGSFESNRPVRSREEEFGPIVGGIDLAIVLSQYDLGMIRSIVPFNRGSERTLKLLVRAEQGDFLLKCRAGMEADTARVGFSHRVHRHLAQRNFPVAPLIESRRSGRYAVLQERRVYELTAFLRGEPFDRKPETCGESGRTLARFHRELLDLKTNWVPLAGACHALPELLRPTEDAARWFVRRERAAARRAEAGVEPEQTSAIYEEIGQLARVLIARYQQAAGDTSAEGFETWPRTVVHADWHPGNLMYKGGQILAVIDLDSVRLAPRIIDLAYGALQFSVRAPGPDPEQWPADLDLDRYRAFCHGYDTLAEDFMLSRAEIRVLPNIMIEYLIAESLLNAATSQRRNREHRLAFLRMIERKTAWIEGNCDHLRSILDA